MVRGIDMLNLMTLNYLLFFLRFFFLSFCICWVSRSFRLSRWQKPIYVLYSTPSSLTINCHFNYKFFHSQLLNNKSIRIFNHTIDLLKWVFHIFYRSNLNLMYAILYAQDILSVCRQSVHLAFVFASALLGDTYALTHTVIGVFRAFAPHSNDLLPHVFCMAHHFYGILIFTHWRNDAVNEFAFDEFVWIALGKHVTCLRGWIDLLASKPF